MSFPSMVRARVTETKRYVSEVKSEIFIECNLCCKCFFFQLKQINIFQVKYQNYTKLEIWS